MDDSGLLDIRRHRLEALVAQLDRELPLAESYPEVRDRLRRRLLRAQLELTELASSSPPLPVTPR